MRFGRRNPFLYDIEDLPMSFVLKLQVENVLLLFMMYLAAADNPPLRGSTIRAYVGHVKSLHVRHTQGLGFVAMMSATSRIGSVFKTLRVSRPSMMRTKNAFTNEHWCIFYDVVEELKTMGTFSVAQMFRIDRVRTAVAAALTVLCRWVVSVNPATGQISRCTRLINTSNSRQLGLSCKIEHQGEGRLCQTKPFW